MLNAMPNPRPVLIDKFASHTRLELKVNIPDVQHILNCSRTNFNIVKKPLLIQISHTIDDKCKFPFIETGKFILGKEDKLNHVFNSVVTNRYHVIQNSDMLELAMNIINEFNNQNEFKPFIYYNSGSTPDSSICYYSFKVTDIELPIIGKTDYYLVVVANHNKCSCKIMFTPVRVACHNALDRAYRSSGWSLLISHKSKISDKKLLTNFSNFFFKSEDSLKKDWQDMNSRTLEFDTYKIILRELYQIKPTMSIYDKSIDKRVRKAIADLGATYYDGLGQASLEDHTVAKAVSAITCYEQNYIDDKKVKLKTFFEPLLSHKFYNCLKKHLN